MNWFMDEREFWNGISTWLDFFFDGWKHSRGTEITRTFVLDFRLILDCKYFDSLNPPTNNNAEQLHEN